ncbi:nucleotidyltransferase family protein [Microvirga makkahensis]|uniref:NTP transferase domain-containing protein n=1 Tax=Microvirga makkahensis TaxID=1128670 RepID=A0A7X3MTW1_9HYPH|nr:nucleotidyltransferase family protein [Microvirga makkahensis]MXQ13166.1 NTP transferase domain-containing protein [Microvirga makkahensis]
MSRETSDVAAILLAAGRGTRFGDEPKLLAQVGGKSLVRHAAEAAIRSTADPVVVVTGHLGEEVAAALEGLPVRIVRNALYAQGLSTSLKAGFSALPRRARAAIVLLGDMPFVTAGLIDALAAAWRDGGEPAALVPTLNGRRGNPVVLSRALQGEIESLSGDAGAGPVLRGRPDVLEWPTTDPAVAQDIDTREELAGLRP